jgi:Xaa-Pro aminopeptidase
MNGKDKVLLRYREVQDLAKKTIEFLSDYIELGVTEADISKVADDFMLSNGADSFWYYDVGSLVLIGERTLLSVSGIKYKPTQTKVKETDLVTVDLSPKAGIYWGDYARSFIISQGKVLSEQNELSEGINIENTLHEELIKHITPSMTFEGVYKLMNNMINQLGYINIDFNSNLGHSIETQMNKRIYIEKGNTKKLSEVKMFTFEPHIKKVDGTLGYKREDIYYFSEGKYNRL